jgi:ketosteroid isomerase-like protein
MTQTAEDVYECVRRYLVAWKEGDWEKLHQTLAENIRFQEPAMGTVEGVDAHIELYREHRRFPNLDEMVLLKLLSDVDGAIASYDVYLSGRRHTVFDQFSVEAGRITLVISVKGEWSSPTR